MQAKENEVGANKNVPMVFGACAKEVQLLKTRKIVQQEKMIIAMVLLTKDASVQKKDKNSLVIQGLVILTLTHLAVLVNKNVLKKMVS